MDTFQKVANVNWKTKNQVLNIIVSGKGVIPYEKIDAIDALQKEPEDGIFFFKRRLF